MGQRRVMCEMSDFDQTLNGKGPANLQQMEAATAWQMAFGVTDFMLYYTISYGNKYPDRNEALYKEYCNFVGRINSLVMEATPVRKALLYYPIYDLQREYIPTAAKMSVSTQSDLMKRLETSFRALGSNLLKAQTQFVLADYLSFEFAKVNENGTIQIGQNQYSSISFPKGIVLPSAVSEVVKEAKSKGVKMVFSDDFKETPSPVQLSELVGEPEKLTPSNTTIAFGKFIREGKELYLLVNTGKESYKGVLEVSKGGQYIESDPRTGDISGERNLSGKKLPIQLAPLQTKIFTVL